MTFDQIETALGQHLAGMVDCPPIAWPNADAPGVVPYLEVAHAPNTITDPTLDGTSPGQSGIFLVTVVAERGKFSGPANAIAQRIASRFPYGIRLSAGAGTVLIDKPSEPAPGFTDGTYWRQPVRIRYQTET